MESNEATARTNIKHEAWSLEATIEGDVSYRSVGQCCDIIDVLRAMIKDRDTRIEELEEIVDDAITVQLTSGEG